MSEPPLGIEPKLWKEVSIKPQGMVSCMFRLNKQYLESSKLPVSNNPHNKNPRAQKFEEECLQLFQQVGIPIHEISHMQCAANLNTCMIRTQGQYIRSLVLNPLVINAKLTSH